MDRKSRLSSHEWLRVICALALSGALLLSTASTPAAVRARPLELATPSFTDFSTGSPTTALKGGPPGAWDELVREKVQVIQDGAAYKMWYVGHPRGNSKASKVGYATSTNGVTWTKYAGNPIINRTSQDQDISVLKLAGSSYVMYVEVNDTVIDLFTSTDGIHWSLHPSSPVKRNAASPVVWKESGSWYMLYESMIASPFYNIHLASSPNGMNWTDNPSNPVIAENRDTVPDSVVKESAYYHLYYHANNGDTAWPAWHALSTNRVSWTGRREISYNYSSQFTFVKGDGQIWSYVWNLMGDNSYYLRYGAQPAPLAREELYWRLDEKSGTTASDYSGNGVSGQLQNGPVWAAGKINGGLKFDGTNDWVETGYNTDFARWTVSAWVKSPAAPGSAQPSGPVHREMSFQINWNHPNTAFRGAAALRVRGKWYAAKFGTLNPTTWYHLTATYDGETLRAYKNGVLITANAAPSGIPDSEPLTLKFGRQALSSVYFQGMVDEVQIFQRALSTSEVSGLAVPASGDGIIRVNTTSGGASDGLCSLAEAMLSANTDAPVDSCPAGSGGDTILLPPGAYSLTGTGQSSSDAGGMEILDSLTIVGDGGPVSIDAAGLPQLFRLGSEAAEVYLSNVEIVNSTASLAGDARIQIAPVDDPGDPDPAGESTGALPADASDRPDCPSDDIGCSPDSGGGEGVHTLWLPVIRQ